MAKLERNGIPTQRYAKDVAGMPVFAATKEFLVMVSEENMKDSVPADDENCAIAKGCRIQLNTPYVSVGRSRTDLALPHPQGVKKPEYGETLWAVLRFKNSRSAREVIVAADTGGLTGEGGVTVELLPPNDDNSPAGRKAKNQRAQKKKRDRTKKSMDATPDALTAMGVRLLTGQRRR
jgi:hypothetical protein